MHTPLAHPNSLVQVVFLGVSTHLAGMQPLGFPPGGTLRPREPMQNYRTKFANSEEKHGPVQRNTACRPFPQGNLHGEVSYTLKYREYTDKGIDSRKPPSHCNISSPFIRPPPMKFEGRPPGTLVTYGTNQALLPAQHPFCDKKIFRFPVPPTGSDSARFPLHGPHNLVGNPPLFTPQDVQVPCFPG